MRRITRLALLAASVVLAAASCLSQTSASQPFTIAIAAVQRDFKVGVEIRVRITLTNTSGRELLVGRAKGDARAEEAGYRIEVVNERGKNPPETKYQRVVKGEADDILVSSPVGFTVQPGKTFEDAMIANKFYDLSQPGKYKIQVQRTEPATGILVKSNTITVTVTP